jgi:hypothetical protein
MTKYDLVKTLKLTTARLPHTCNGCGGKIEKGSRYYRESLGLLAKPPGLQLRSYCLACGNPRGARGTQANNLGA